MQETVINHCKWSEMWSYRNSCSVRDWWCMPGVRV